MFLEALYNLYDDMSNAITYIFTDIFHDNANFSEAEIKSISKYIESINMSHNLHIVMEHLDVGHIVLICTNNIYVCIHKIRDHLYVTKMSNDKNHKLANTLSELYDLITILAIKKKLKYIYVENMDHNYL